MYKFLIIGEIAAVGGDKEPYKAYRTVERTGLDAALGINNIHEMLWKTPSGDVKPEQYFDLFRNALYIDKGSHKWIGEKVVTMLDGLATVDSSLRREELSSTSSIT